MARPDPPLDEVALAISAALQPGSPSRGASGVEWLAALDALAAECPTPTAAGVAAFLFDELGFRGNVDDYQNWRNSCLDHVIERRTGIPITLSIVMIEVARRVGVPLVGVGMPAHFIVASADDPDVLFDPFAGGRRLDRAGARTLMTTVTNGQVPWQDRFLDPTPARAIVIRMLNNLRGVLTARGDAIRLAVVMGLRDELPELAGDEAIDIVRARAILN